MGLNLLGAGRLIYYKSNEEREREREFMGVVGKIPPTHNSYSIHSIPLCLHQKEEPLTCRKT